MYEEEKVKVKGAGGPFICKCEPKIGEYVNKRNAVRQEPYTLPGPQKLNP